MSAAGRCAAQDKKAASPLISGRLPRSRPGDAPREGTGPPLQRQACGDGPAGRARAPEPLRPLRQETGAGASLPRTGRGASGDHRAPRTSGRQETK